MKKKFFSLLSIAVAGSLSIGSAAMAATVNGSGATFPQSFLASATTAFKAAVPAPPLTMQTRVAAQVPVNRHSATIPSTMQVPTRR